MNKTLENLNPIKPKRLPESGSNVTIRARLEVLKDPLDQRRYRRICTW